MNLHSSMLHKKYQIYYVEHYIYIIQKIHTYYLCFCLCSSYKDTCVKRTVSTFSPQGLIHLGQLLQITRISTHAYIMLQQISLYFPVLNYFLSSSYYQYLHLNGLNAVFIILQIKKMKKLKCHKIIDIFATSSEDFTTVQTLNLHVHYVNFNNCKFKPML